MKLLFLCAATAFATQDTTPPTITLDLVDLNYAARNCDGHPCTEKTSKGGGHATANVPSTTTEQNKQELFQSATCEYGSSESDCPLPSCKAYDHHDVHCKDKSKCGHLTGKALTDYCWHGALTFHDWGNSPVRSHCHGDCDGTSTGCKAGQVCKRNMSDDEMKAFGCSGEDGNGASSGPESLRDFCVDEAYAKELYKTRPVRAECTRSFECRSTIRPININGAMTSAAKRAQQFNDVDRNLRSEWLITYDATDAAGNDAESVSFTMIFQDTQAPSLETEFCARDLPTRPQHRDHGDHDRITVVSGMDNGRKCSGTIQRKFAQACTECQADLAADDQFAADCQKACTHTLLKTMKSWDGYDKDVTANIRATLTSPSGVDTRCAGVAAVDCDIKTKELGDWVIEYTSHDNASMFGWQEANNEVYQTVTIKVVDTRKPHIYIEAYGTTMDSWMCAGDTLHPVIECKTGKVYKDPAPGAICKDLRESWTGNSWQHEHVTADSISHVNVASLNTATPEEFECAGGPSSDGVPAVCTNQPIDIAFVLDSSGSIGSSNYANMKNQVGEIIKGLDISANMIQVGAHAYSHERHNALSTSGFNLNEHYGDANVETAIDALPFHSSMTWTGTAIQHTMNTIMVPSGGRRAGVPAAMIIVTDGKPNGESSTLAKTAAAAARADGVEIFSIGVGGTYNLQNLKDMASTPYADHVYELSTFDVAQFKEKLLTTICTQASGGNNNGGAYDCSLKHEASFQYTDAGAKCSDTIDGEVTYTTINPVDVETTGTYIVTYRAENTVGLWNDGKNDAGTADVHSCLGGNQQYFRTVTVIDTLKPKIVVKYQGKRVAAGAAQDKAVHDQTIVNPASQFMAEEAGSSVNAWTLGALASAAAGIALVAQSRRRTEIATSVPV